MVMVHVGAIIYHPAGKRRSIDLMPIYSHDLTKNTANRTYLRTWDVRKAIQW